MSDVEFLLGLINVGSGWLVLVSVQLGLGGLVPWRPSYIAIKLRSYDITGSNCIDRLSRSL